MNSKNFSGICVLLVGLVIPQWEIVAADSYELVSVEEYERSVEADTGDDDFFDRAPDPLAPKIDVKRPGEGSEYTAPVDIEIAFVAAAGSSIDLDTLKITYGALGINVTERVTENAEVTANGILSEGASLPKGRHKLTIFISDSDGREGKRRFKFRIIE